jgi:hypothetical protein
MRIHTKMHAPFSNIGAGDVHLQGVDSGVLIEHSCQGDILLSTLTADVHNESGSDVVKKRELLLKESFDPHVLESNAAEETGGNFRGTVRVASDSGFQGNGFDRHRAQPIQVEKGGVFLPVSEGAGCGYHRVLKFDTAKIYF